MTNRARSRQSALKYLAMVGSELNKRRIQHLMNFLASNGWSQEELEDLMVVEYLWDDNSDLAEVVAAIEALPAT